MYKVIEEGSVKLYVPKEEKISKSLPVFYNSDMKLGRDIAIDLINKLEPKSVCDTMAGTGVRALRILKETKCEEVVANELNPVAVKIIKKNAKSNKLKLNIEHKDANILLREERFDYIDIDPFGSPSFFLDSASSSINNKGILAVTATDLSSLYGRHINACKRKYNATPLNCSLNRELGARILAHTAQLIAAKYDKALYPIFTQATSHYIRMYFRCSVSRSLTNKVLKNIGYAHYCPKCLEVVTTMHPSDIKCCGDTILIGPLWLGHLWDERLAEDFTLIKHIAEESKIHNFGYYDIPTLCKKLKMNSDKKLDLVIKEIQDKGYQASRTHFSLQAIRTDMPLKKFLKII